MLLPVTQFIGGKKNLESSAQAGQAYSLKAVGMLSSKVCSWVPRKETWRFKLSMQSILPLFASNVTTFLPAVTWTNFLLHISSIFQ